MLNRLFVMTTMTVFYFFTPNLHAQSYRGHVHQLCVLKPGESVDDYDKEIYSDIYPCAKDGRRSTPIGESSGPTLVTLKTNRNSRSVTNYIADSKAAPAEGGKTKTYYRLFNVENSTYKVEDRRSGGLKDRNTIEDFRVAYEHGYTSSYKQTDWISEDLLLEKPTEHKPIRVYTDGTPGKSVQIFDEPFSNYSTNEAGFSKGVAWPKIGEDSKKNTKFHYYVKSVAYKPDYNDPLRHEERPAVFYEIDQVPVDEVDKYLNNLPVKGLKTGWIDAENIRTSRLFDTDEYKPDRAPTKAELKKIQEKEVTEAIVGPPDCPSCRAPKTPVAPPLPKSDIDNIRYKSALQATPCLTSRSATVKEKSIKGRNLISGFKEVWKSKMKDSKYANLDPSTLMAIDAMARTIYGEIRSCLFNGERYFQAQARIFINRAQHCQKKTPCNLARVDSRGNEESLVGKSLPDAILGTLERTNTSLVWNSNDANSRIMFCVPSKPADREAWNAAVDAAAESVLNTVNFKWLTRNMSDNDFHAVALTPKLRKSPTPWMKKKTLVTNIRINNLPLDNTRCLAIYRTKPGGTVLLPTEQLRDNLYALSVGTFGQSSICR